LRQIDDEDVAELADGGDEASAETSQENRWYDPPRFLADHAPINYSARIGLFLQGIRTDGRNNENRAPVPLAASANRT
jgi:hypothetical protein